MKYTSNTKGQIAVNKTELRAIELGYIPSKPIYNVRYDLVLDDGNKLTRIQIKYADGVPSHSTGAIVVKLGHENRKKQKSTYGVDEIDAIIVYLPKIDKLCYLPPNTFTGKNRIYIRYEESKNKQKKGIIFAENYYW